MEKLLIDGTFDSEHYTYNAYKEYCSDMEMDVYPEDSEEFRYWQTDEFYNAVECFFDLLEENNLSENNVVVSGVIGKWYGKREIVPEVISTFKKAYTKMLSDIDTFRLFQKDDYLELIGHHHDGDNIYKIVFLDDDDNEINISNL